MFEVIEIVFNDESCNSTMNEFSYTNNMLSQI